MSQLQQKVSPIIVRLRRFKRFRCTGCGQTVLMTADGFAKLDAALAAFEKEAADIQFIIETVRLSAVPRYR